MNHSFLAGMLLGFVGRAFIFAFLIAVGPARAQQHFDTAIGAPTGSQFFNTPSLRIDTNSRVIVTIKPDGSIEYGEGYTPDAAAKALWDAVGLERKTRN